MIPALGCPPAVHGYCLGVGYKPEISSVGWSMMLTTNTKVVSLIPVCAVHLWVGLDDPCGFPSNPNPSEIQQVHASGKTHLPSSVVSQYKWFSPEWSNCGKGNNFFNV